MKYYYPAVFTPKGCGLKGYELEFPDVPGCFTMGDDVDECLQMAQDALGLMLEDYEDGKYPAPSEIGEIDLKDYPEGSFVKVVCFDKAKYDAATVNPIKHASSCFGLNIKQTAELLGAPYRTVQSWFNGTRRPAPWVERLIIEKIQGTL